MITMDTIKMIRESLPFKEGASIESCIARAAFNLVSNPEDWKAEIHARVNLRRIVDFDPDVIAWAVGFYTGTEAKLTLEGDDLIVESIGYRAGPAGP